MVIICIFMMTDLSLPLFLFNDTATTEIYTLSLHDALPIFNRCWDSASVFVVKDSLETTGRYTPTDVIYDVRYCPAAEAWQDRKSTRLNSSHANISYAVFCLKKKLQTYSCRPILFDTKYNIL